MFAASESDGHRPSKFAKSALSTLTTSISRNLPYRYDQLKENQIRLLKLFPGDASAHIQCSLHTVNLLEYDDLTAESSVEGLESYEALSYVWGERSGRVRITCGGRYIRITRNLADALRKFRDPTVTQILWADALCINQKDNNERASQVQLMGLIYFKARQVRIWLGREDETHEPFRACHAVSLIKMFAQPDLSYSDQIARDWCEQLFSIPHFADDSKWTAVRRLLDRMWFRRVWVVQELGLSRRATFYCSDAQFTRTELYEFVRLLEYHRDGIFMTYDIDVRLLRLGKRYYNATWGGGRIELGSDPQQAETFFDIMAQTRGLKCTDRRDSVYAFLGHPSAFKRHKLDVDPYYWYPRNYYASRPTIISPNYNKSVSYRGVYTELAINAIKTHGIGLQVLSHVCHNQETIEADFPSWVPIWNIINQASSFHGCESFYRASGSLPSTALNIYTPVGDLCSSRMSLRALRLGVMRYIIQKPVGSSVATLAETLFPERAEGLTYVAGSDDHKMNALDWQDVLQNSHSVVNDWSAFALTLTAGLMTTHESLAACSVGQNLSRHTKGLDCYIRYCERGPTHTLSEEDKEIAEYFNLDLYRSALFRGFYITTNSRYGLAPLIAQEGDEIWLPMGATMPFLFRPLSEAVYKIIGQTYLHGSMKGESVEGKTEKDFRTIILC